MTFLANRRLFFPFWIFLLSSVLPMGCGYQAPLVAEEYDPKTKSDHKIDLMTPESALALYQIMKDTHEVFTQCNLPYWADSGTALGAVRNAGIIPWDDDNDTAIASQDVSRLLILRPIFAELGYFIEKVFFGYRVVKPDTTAAVDIFLMNEKDGRFYYDRGDWGTRKRLHELNGEAFTDAIYITREELYPLKEIQFGPVRVTVPHDPKPYLEAMFRGWEKVAFTYGHLGQRKFKINLDLFPEFKRPAPLNLDTFQHMDLTGSIKNRVSPDLKCPVLEKNRDRILPVRPFFDGV